MFERSRPSLLSRYLFAVLLIAHGVLSFLDHSTSLLNTTSLDGVTAAVIAELELR